MQNFQEELWLYIHLLMRIKATLKVLGKQPKLKKKAKSTTKIAAVRLKPNVSYQLKWSSALISSEMLFHLCYAAY